jgi:hypothetical protein
MVLHPVANLIYDPDYSVFVTIFFIYPVRGFRAQLRSFRLLPGLRLPQVEGHWSRQRKKAI